MRIRKNATLVLTSLEVKLTPAQLADAFCSLDDEGMAQFFIEVARVAEGWRPGGNPGMQFHLVGAHLRDCECSTDDAREMVHAIEYGMRPKATA